MAIIQGIPVILYDKRQIGVDDLNAPIYTEMPVTVKDVLIYPADATDVVNDLQLYGKRVEYELCIPKDDTHIWEDRRVDFFGQSFHTVGFAREYIVHLVPLGWNRQIRVERYG